ncbi:MAG: hypothetical protein WBV45_06905 [Lutimonas sp.]
MRAKYFLTGHLYFFLILAACIGLTSCNSDDEDEIVQQTWLEKYDGTKWNDGSEVYIKIIGNTSVILESWFLDDSCYVYNVYLYELIHENANLGIAFFEIIENSTNKLVFQVKIFESTETITLRVNGDTLTIKRENNAREGWESKDFKKTTVDFDDFTICDM